MISHLQSASKNNQKKIRKVKITHLNIIPQDFNLNTYIEDNEVLSTQFEFWSCSVLHIMKIQEKSILFLFLTPMLWDPIEAVKFRKIGKNVLSESSSFHILLVDFCN